MPDADELQRIPVSRTYPSPTNPRKSFHEAKLVELAESIRSHGVVQPILARRWPDGDDSWKAGQHDKTPPVDAVDKRPTYQIVTGERRWRASVHAEQRVVPALVRALTDKQVAEIQVIENDQRDDVPPLEQAAGYKRLLELGDDVPTIAAKIGRPAAYVTGRLRLGDLIDPLKSDMAAGKLPFGHGYVLSRLTPADQEYVHKKHLYQSWGEHAVCSMSDLKRIIRSELCPDLADAPWDLKDATLTPAGACVGCPKRKKTDSSLFDGLAGLTADGENPHEYLDPGEKLDKHDRAEIRRAEKADLCIDRACFQAKREAFIQIGVRKAAETSGREEGDVLRVSTEHYGCEDRKALLAGRYTTVPASKAKNDPKCKPAIVVHGDKVGETIYVKVKKAPKQNGHVGAAKQYDWEAENRRRERERKITELAAAAMIAAVYTAVAERTKGDGKFWEELAPHLGWVSWEERRKAIVNAGGKPLADLVADPETRTAALVAVTIASEWRCVNADAPKPIKRLLGMCNVDAKKFRDEAAAAVEAEEQEAKKKAGEAADANEDKAKAAGNGKPRKMSRGKRAKAKA